MFVLMHVCVFVLAFNPLPNSNPPASHDCFCDFQFLNFFGGVRDIGVGVGLGLVERVTSGCICMCLYMHVCVRVYAWVYVLLPGA